MLFLDVERHNLPHIHADYQDYLAVYSIYDGKILAGSIPSGEHKLIATWIEIHKEELLSDWQLAVNGKTTFQIMGLDK